MRLKIWRKLEIAVDRVAPPQIETDLVTLYECEAPRMRRWLARRYSPEKAADLVQSAFVLMLGLGPDRLGELVHPRAYLYRAAENLAKDHAKSAAFRCERQGDPDHSVSEDPGAALEARDMLRRIEAAIPLLPDRTREVFMAHRFENLSYRQIAERHGLTIKVVEHHIAAAMRELHRAVGNRR